MDDDSRPDGHFISFAEHQAAVKEAVRVERGHVERLLQMMRQWADTGCPRCGDPEAVHVPKLESLAPCTHCGGPMGYYTAGCPARDDPGGPCEVGEG